MKSTKKPLSKRVRILSPDQWNRIRLETVLRDFKKKRILVIGDVGVDRYTLGSVERISPEAPVPIVFVESETLKLGLAANVADNIQVLKGVPWLVGIIGADRTAQDLKKLLKSCKIQDRHLIQDEKRRTVLKERIVTESQQLLRVDYESLEPLSTSVENALICLYRKLLREADAVILQDYAKGLVNRSLAERVFSEAMKCGKRVSVDPNAKTSLAVYKGASILTPNIREAESLVGFKVSNDSDLFRAGKKILRETGARWVVITRGKEGMAVFSSQEPEVLLVPTYAREVFDVSGAGDTVISVLTLALAAGSSIEEAVILGNLAAGVEVGKRGTATVSPDEISQAMDFFLLRNVSHPQAVTP